jgi:hypothetical protein
VSVAAGVSIESRPTGSRYFGQTRVTTAGRDVARLVVPLRRTASLSGRLVWEDARSGGQGIIDVSGASGDPSLGYLSSRGDVATPDQFVIDGLLSGEYVFAINRGAAVSGRAIRSITCDGAEYTYAPISITAGTDVADCVVTITSALPTVSGVVADRPGKSAPVEAAVIAFPVQREQWRGYGMRPARLKGFQVRSDGAFQFHTLPAGDYYFIAVPAALVDAWQDPAFLERVASQATRVRLAWGAAAVQNLALQSVR